MNMHEYANVGVTMALQTYQFTKNTNTLLNSIPRQISSRIYHLLHINVTNMWTAVRTGCHGSKI